MNPVIGKCPICGEELTVTRLDCSHCGTEIGGQFALGRLYRLDSAALRFVEVFVKNRGSAYRAGEEMGLPYSAVRARLTEIIRTLGYDPSPEPKEDTLVPPERRKTILDDLAQGKISADDAVRMLNNE